MNTSETLSDLFEKILSFPKDKPIEELKSLMQDLFSKSAQYSLKSILQREHTEQSAEVWKLNRKVCSLFKRLAVDASVDSLMTFFTGYLYAQFDILELCSHELSLYVDDATVKAVMDYEYGYRTLQTIYDQGEPYVTELSATAELEGVDVSKILETFKQKFLVYIKKYGDNIYEDTDDIDDENTTCFLTPEGRKVLNYIKHKHGDLTSSEFEHLIERMLEDLQYAFKENTSAAITSVVRTIMYRISPHVSRTCSIEELLCCVANARSDGWTVSFRYGDRCYQRQGESNADYKLRMERESVEHEKWLTLRDRRKIDEFCRKALEQQEQEQGRENHELKEKQKKWDCSLRGRLYKFLGKTRPV